MLFGLDYAWGDPGVAALKAAGVKFVCRYLSTPGNTKNLRAAEAAALRAAGIDVVVVFETSAQRALAGARAGVNDAKSARAQATACGLPGTTPIYFAVDFDARPEQQVAIDRYLRAAAVALGGKDRVGVYGGLHVVKRALDAGVCKYGWQTYAWSGGEWEPRAQLRQFSNGHRLNGVSVDYDHAVQADFGQAGASRPRYRWRVTYFGRDGKPAVKLTLTPRLWLARHPRVFRRGDVLFDRRGG